LLILFYTICASFLSLSIRWVYSIIYTYHWVQKETDIKLSVDTNKECLFILIPVLAEVGRIEKTVEYFIGTFSRDVNIKLVLITSESEYLYYPKTQNTIFAAKELAKRHNDKVIHCHYPKTNGRMSHQLNWGIKNLGESITGDSLIAIYNADSKPHPETFKWILFKRSLDPDLNVFQQHGDYTKNINSKTNSIILSAALWQNRWAIGFELFKAIRSVKSYKNNFFRPLNYLIGHGLIISKSVYDKSVGFSEIFHNEDAILGLELSFIKEKITPLPYFDISDTPDTIPSLYRQKIHWFLGPSQSFNYFKYLSKKYRGYSLKERTVLLFQAFKLFLHAIYWIFGPVFMFFIILYPIGAKNISLLAISYSIFFLYFTLPNFLALNLYEPKKTKRQTLNLIYSFLGGGLICYFLHGLSAISSIFLTIKYLFMGKQIAKGKTMMKKSENL